jgi:hypothetical protein
MKSRISKTEMARAGWTRIDRRPWKKTNATWLHRSDWRLQHCGHPTALHPWMLFDPTGRMILTGAGHPPAFYPEFGTCWDDLRSAVGFVRGRLAKGAVQQTVSEKSGALPSSAAAER